MNKNKRGKASREAERIAFVLACRSDPAYNYINLMVPGDNVAHILQDHEALKRSKYPTAWVTLLRDDL